MRRVLDTEHDRRLEVEENEDTGGLTLHEIDDDGDRKWQIAHLDVETFEERIESERYERLDEDSD